MEFWDENIIAAEPLIPKLNYITAMHMQQETFLQWPNMDGGYFLREMNEWLNCAKANEVLWKSAYYRYIQHRWVTYKILKTTDLTWYLPYISIYIWSNYSKLNDTI